ncbi:hypothetical protein SeMB42_g06396 [Synchytrium endobioticum]|uniref:Uncharacterized protein n=1 Tax=Synchytrium endobioticum TaxID=286115 RepID=A0A507DIV3_9FUNG|nr:hypothetical protein SeMB42_g06396 [Synchytrium endobioticum]TPX50838.1 hypothetical protein SeLEV6574_g00643 [Synchytrium endobioticum]
MLGTPTLSTFVGLLCSEKWKTHTRMPERKLLGSDKHPSQWKSTGFSIDGSGSLAAVAAIAVLVFAGAQLQFRPFVERVTKFGGTAAAVLAIGSLVGLLLMPTGNLQKAREQQNVYSTRLKAQVVPMISPERTLILVLGRVLMTTTTIWLTPERITILVLRCQSPND